jgi:hypothetical protein
MEYDEDGEHFKPGTAIHNLHSEYTAAKKRAHEAIAAYNERRSQLPYRPRKLDGPDPALGADYGNLNANYTALERVYYGPLPAPEWLLIMSDAFRSRAPPSRPSGLQAPKRVCRFMLPPS